MIRDFAIVGVNLPEYYIGKEMEDLQGYVLRRTVSNGTRPAESSLYTRNNLFSDSRTPPIALVVGSSGNERALLFHGEKKKTLLYTKVSEGMHLQATY